MSTLCWRRSGFLNINSIGTPALALISDCANFICAGGSALADSLITWVLFFFSVAPIHANDNKIRVEQMNFILCIYF